MPVIFGPNHSKFKEALDLIACGGGFSVGSREEFEATIGGLLSSSDALSRSGKAAGKYIQDNLGATDRIYDEIFTHLD